MISNIQKEMMKLKKIISLFYSKNFITTQLKTFQNKFKKYIIKT